MIIIIILSLVACTKNENEYIPEKTAEQKEAEKFKVNETLINNFYTACEAVDMTKNNIDIDSISLSDDKSEFFINFQYHRYSFNAIADKDNIINTISIGNTVLMQDGNVINHDVNNYVVTSAQHAKLTTQAEYDVKNNLISPATAEFPGYFLHDDEWIVYRDHTTFIVESWVDAQNEYGALLRYNFTATYDWDGTDDTEPVLIDVVISQ